jgi:hypothetical protein
MDLMHECLSSPFIASKDAGKRTILLSILVFNYGARELSKE